MGEPPGKGIERIPSLQALWSQSEELRLLLREVPVMVIAVDEKGSFVFWNRECERVSGWTAREIVGNPAALERLYPDRAYRAALLDERSRRTGNVRDLELTLTRKDGTTRVVSWSTFSGTFPRPGWTSWGVGVDVTGLRQKEKALSLLAEVNRRLLRREPLATTHAYLCAELAATFALRLVSIGLKSPDGTVTLSGVAGPNAGHSRAEEVRWDAGSSGGLTGLAIATGGVQRRTARDGPGFGRWRHPAAAEGVKATLALPLVARGSVLGAVTLHGAHVDTFDPETTALLSRFTEQVALSLDHAADLREIELQSLALDAFELAVFIMRPDRTIEWTNPAFTRLTGYCRDEIIGRTPELLVAGHQDDTVTKSLWETVRSGRTWRGELTARRRDGTVYVADETVTPIKGPGGAILHFVSVQRDVTETKRQEERIVHLARHDPLTELPNRRVVEEELEKLLARAARGTRSAVLLVDLDGFKLVNDRLGHAAGDQVLREVGRAFLEAVRPGDVVGRVGGDEFVVLLEGVSPDEARTAGERLRERIGQIPPPDGYDGPTLGASVGIALVDGQSDATGVLADADVALYAAKARGRGRVEMAPGSIEAPA